MKKKDFYNELIEFLEFEPIELTENTELKSIEGYDSMAVMSLIAFCDEKFGKKNKCPANSRAYNCRKSN